MLSPWKKSYDTPRQHIKKHRHHFPDRSPYSQSYGFPVVMYGHETIKKAEYRRIDAFELWCWRRLLRAPWTARRSNQSILKEISPEYSLDRLMLKLKFQCFGHVIWKADSLEKTLMLGKIEGRRRRGRHRMRWLDGITDSVDMSLSKLQRWWRTEKPGVLQSMGVTKSRTWLSDWTTTNDFFDYLPQQNNNNNPWLWVIYNQFRRMNISCKDGLDKGQKWYGPNRSRRY